MNTIIFLIHFIKYKHYELLHLINQKRNKNIHNRKR